MRGFAVLRPEPGNAATAARLAATGADVLRLPLFAVAPVAWWTPPAGDHDALFLTSANAIRHAGSALADYRALPVYAVGAATARAAEAFGLTVVATGDADAAALAARAQAAGVRRALHPGGEARAGSDLPGVSAAPVVYRTVALTIAPADLARLHGRVALVHSPRAGARLAALLPERGEVALAAISPAAVAAAGTGWAATGIAAVPTDPALIAAARALAGD